MRKSALFISALLLVATAPWLAPRSSRAEGPVELNLGSLIPLGTPWRTLLDDIERHVETATEGSINVILRPPGVMSELELVRETRRGTRLQAASTTTAALAEGSNLAKLQLVELPFLFRSPEEADHILDHVIFEDIHAALYKRGFVLALWSENGWRSMATKTHAVHRPSDLAGLKMRAQPSRVHEQMYTDLGAQAVAKPMTEVLTSLNSGLLDGLDQPPLYLSTSGLADAVEHYTLTRHIYQPTAIVVSRPFFDALTPQQQSAITSLDSLAPSGRQAVREAQAAALADLRTQLDVVDLSADDAAVWERSATASHSQLASSIAGGSTLLERIQAALAEYRAK